MKEDFDPPPLQPIGQTEVLHCGRPYIYFGGCDYLRLSVHPQVIQAVQQSAVNGLGVAASRLTTGNHPELTACEQDLGRFFGSKAALVGGSGYGINLALGQALAGRFSHALLDERSHVSLRDAVAFLGATVCEFRHRDPESLESSFRALPPGSTVVVITDGLFPLEGTVPPFREYWQRLGNTVTWWIDDCHAAGTLGQQGKGSWEHHGLAQDGICQVITFSKALGTFGGALLADPAIVQSVWTRSRWFAGATPPPIPYVAATRTSLKLLASDTARLRRLQSNVEWVKAQLFDNGLLPERSPGPMFLVIPASDHENEVLRRKLLTAGIFPSFIRYPGGPESGAYRFAISSEHSAEQLSRLVSVLI